MIVTCSIVLKIMLLANLRRWLPADNFEGGNFDLGPNVYLRSGVAASVAVLSGPLPVDVNKVGLSVGGAADLIVITASITVALKSLLVWFPSLDEAAGDETDGEEGANFCKCECSRRKRSSLLSSATGKLIVML